LGAAKTEGNMGNTISDGNWHWRQNRLIRGDPTRKRVENLEKTLHVSGLMNQMGWPGELE
jgi:hypothetical protein